MKTSSILRLVRMLTLTAVLLLVGGCLISDGPFYEEKQIVQDQRFEGVFADSLGGDGSTWEVSRDEKNPGKYSVVTRGNSSTNELLGTLFRVDGMLFLDLTSLRIPAKDLPGDVISNTATTRANPLQARHVVWKVGLSTNGVAYSFPVGDGAMAALKEAPELKDKFDQKNYQFLLPDAPRDAQKYLLKFATNSEVFNYKGEMKRTR